MKAIYTANTQAPERDPEFGACFWVSIDGQSWLPVGEPDRPLEADDYEQVAELFARKETSKFGKKSWSSPITFARRFLFWDDKNPVFHDPIVLEE